MCVRGKGGGVVGGEGRGEKGEQGCVYRYVQKSGGIELPVAIRLNILYSQTQWLQ